MKTFLQAFKKYKSILKGRTKTVRVRVSWELQVRVWACPRKNWVTGPSLSSMNQGRCLHCNHCQTLTKSWQQLNGRLTTTVKWQIGIYCPILSSHAMTSLSIRKTRHTSCLYSLTWHGRFLRSPQCLLRLNVSSLPVATSSRKIGHHLSPTVLKNSSSASKTISRDQCYKTFYDCNLLICVIS